MARRRWTPGCDSSDTTAGLAARLSTAAPPPGHARRRGSPIGPRPRRSRAGIARAARRRRAAGSDVAGARPASALGSWSRPPRASRASEREEGNVYTTVCVFRVEREGGRQRGKLEGSRESLGQTCQCAEPRWPELRWWRRGTRACRPPLGSHSGDDLSYVGKVLSAPLLAFLTVLCLGYHYSVVPALRLRSGCGHVVLAISRAMNELSIEKRGDEFPRS